ncbi:thioredoxin family protein [Acanthopleuribacter pedis]|uniref:Thioredoxin family protein n=1 Tax=Acanthopleuribacter pedis TaxID=442870 RepID=A0A8J7U1Y9_9BACT|nr:thioredoxin family protein [Acanthopleuribacter pedis]MBO1318047.1 thioredoxin family protein [Acanthopleuribacter pedis]
MKRIWKALLPALLFLGASAVAGDDAWITDYNQALEIAKRENKVILINFTGSDWCGWCKRLDREVFSKDTFDDYAEEKLVLLKVDFPKYSKLPQEQMVQNDKLASRYRIRGFPTILMIDAKEQVLLTTGYRPGGPLDYVQHLDEKIK